MKIFNSQGLSFHSFSVKREIKSNVHDLSGMNLIAKKFSFVLRARRKKICIFYDEKKYYDFNNF